MEIETEIFCPLGQTCEEIRENKIYRCRFFSEMAQVDENGQFIPGSEYKECDIHLVSVHLTELKKNIRGVQQAVESRGNEQIKRQDQFLELAHDSRRLMHGN